MENTNYLTETTKAENTTTNVVEENRKSENILDEIEKIMLEEIKLYKNKTLPSSVLSSRLNITDRIVKSANVILSVENLKERRYMNRTERRGEERKLNKMKNN